MPAGFGITTAAYRALPGVTPASPSAIAGALGDGADADDLRGDRARQRGDRRADRGGADAGRPRDRDPRAPTPSSSERTGRPGAARRGALQRRVARTWPAPASPGQYDTFLWIRGADAVLAHVRRCWAGLFGPQVLTYRPDGAGGGDADARRCASASSRWCRRGPPASCSRSTRSPATARRSSSRRCWGLGEGVVSGDVTPDRFRVDKITLEVLAREIADKEVEHRLRPRHRRRSCWSTVEAERRDAPCLDDDADRRRSPRWPRRSSATAARRRTSSGRSTSGGVHVLQVRPETVWSQARAQARRRARPARTASSRASCRERVRSVAPHD